MTEKVDVAVGDKICNRFCQGFVGVYPFLSNALHEVIACLVCVCIELFPSHVTKAPPISRATASAEARNLHLHPPPPASKAVLSWRILVVVCDLNTTRVTGITSMYQADTTWYHAL